MTVIGRQAVVIGAGIAGLSAAAAVSEFFETVHLLEQDKVQSEALPRPGVPQGQHPHVLMSGGFQALSSLLPGLGAELRAAGAIPLEIGRDLRWEVPGLGVFPKRDLGIFSFSLTRPLLEQVIARRVLALPNIISVNEISAVDIVLSADGARVARVEYQQSGHGTVSVPADLVIDATGRAGPIERCLQRHGKPLPPRSRIEVDTRYSTGIFALSSPQDFVASVTFPAAPESSRGGYLLQIGDNLWQALLTGRGEEQPPADHDTFLGFARALATPTIAATLEGAELVGGIRRFAFRESVWRHFGQSASGRLPAGLLPIGDSLCRFNPVYGQGMSAAAIEAALLKATLARHLGQDDPLPRVGKSFLAQAHDLIAIPWSSSTLTDLVYPQTIAERPADLDERLRERREALANAFTNAEAHRDFFRRQQMLFALDGFIAADVNRNTTAPHDSARVTARNDHLLGQY
ncbi:hypothetical protein DWF00_27275 [Bosea caraganae]|uniref:FAD-dependent oxidoreductase n=1 Tax=Bosea caraganae TaxID=2763117 RepID=A0A370L9G9_9HYPH|nr:hypothetical protein [Bosea caraganae]RDJ22024.1 hypothetical protein DWF00_27275 [Bosea caraganae]RDJ27943.1 hypothetical protein DWE98_04880 [Bosea caraganae]